MNTYLFLKLGLILYEFSTCCLAATSCILTLRRDLNVASRNALRFAAKIFFSKFSNSRNSRNSEVVTEDSFHRAASNEWIAVQ